MAHLLLLLLFLSLSLSLLPLLSLSATDTFIYGGCTQLRYSPNSGYESNLNSLLTSLVNSATYTSYNNYTFQASTPQDALYGLYQCRADLSMPDCATCIARAVTQLGALCSDTCGGALQLEGCYVKYDNSTFLGVEDKTVVLKKCGPSVGYEVEAMARRDAVLAAIVGSSGAYRVGGSGKVQGVAQCVGDLSGSECQDCVGEAIGRLKSDCGTADFGDMFLGKCYARYNTHGPPVFSKAHHDKFSGDGEKTFAIIIGLLAGVALLIIFLIFIRKIFQGSGK
ncbi:cysteine-rich repeat secretory protein 60-like [Cucurbita pepo subsp. pepo]|uniref:cysteine-rich repeat secretory protein 60-like n=1 Tax=Cucurbita pepo subsp. pepo TaxID=3664 RepID=UPI000C9D746B|nr:cysteine-rich repeat secretory protein 60-like [Cucurbita pepo subsp. pepo]